MISRLLIGFSKAKTVLSVFSGVETVSLDRRRDFLFDFSASVLQARRLSTGLASLPATDTEAPDDAVLDVWRKELGATSAHTGKKGDLSFLLLKNILYWGSVAMSLYLIFTVFSFF